MISPRLRFSVFLLTTSAAVFSARTADAPADWLKTQGKSAEWIQTTAACREYLGKLKLDDPLTNKHLPRLKERCAILQKTDGFNWKTRTAVEVLEGMLEDLSKGIVPLTRYSGQGLGFGYWSETLQRIEAIWVQVPPGYDPAKSYQLFLFYKCGGGIHRGEDGRAAGGYRPSAEMCRKFDDTFHAWSSLNIQVKGRLGAEIELTEATAELCKDFAIDPERGFLSGFSDGGYTSLWLGSRFPQLVAGIAPEVANWQYQNVEHVGLANLPLLVVDGWSDGGYVEMNFSRFHALSNMGADVAALMGKHGHTYAPYENETTYAKIIDWARARRRNLNPPRVRYATWNLHWHRAYWFSIERMSDPGRAAQVDAQINEGNRIEVSAQNIAAFKLALNEKLVDPAKPVVVVTNGKESYRGPFQPELSVELEPLPAGKFIKGPLLPGDITAALFASTYAASEGDVQIPGRRWLAVRATAAEPWGPKDAKADTEVTEEDLANFHLKLYGGPDTNKLTARIAPDLPVKFEKGKFTVGKRVYDQPTNAVKFICANPLNPKKYVLVFASNDPAIAQQHGYFGVERVDEFRSGDCVVFGVPAAAENRYGVSLGDRRWEIHRTVFDSRWRAPEEPVLGTAAERIDLTALLRLKADAAREATGAEVAIVQRYPPTWNRWHAWLSRGPIVMHDIAMTNMFPEYVTLGEMRGDDLRNVVRTAAASTVLTDKRDPIYDPKASLLWSDIDPARTYRVALDYGATISGGYAYRVELAKLPVDFTFRNEKEFLALAPATRLPVANMRLSSIEFTEAVAGHFQKHGTATPRRACFDPTQYLANPEGNDFGGFDWLHFNMQERALFHLGLKRANEDELGPPRANAKKFADLQIGQTQVERIEFSMSTLDKQLPVRATWTMRRFTITGETNYKLGNERQQAGVIGELTLCKLELTNEGVSNVDGTAVLGSTGVRTIEGSAGVWPSRGDKTAANPYYRGFRDQTGPANQPSQVRAVLFVYPDTVPPTDNLILSSYGYNSGLIGFRQKLVIPAGKTTSLSLLFVDLQRQNDKTLPDLATVLESLKGELLQAAK